MFIKLLKDFGSNKAGDTMEVTNDNLARAYVEAGLAAETDVMTHLTAQFQAELDKIKTESRAAIDELTKTIKNATPSEGPPSRGLSYDANGVPINSAEEVRGGEASAERGKTSFGEILNLIYRKQFTDDAGERTYATDRLEKVYQFERTSFDPEKGSRTVSRAGTESLGGGATYGYLIKPQFYGSLFEIAMEESVIEPTAFQVPIGNNLELRWPALDQYLTPSTGQSAIYAGVQVFRKGENTARSYQDAKLREIVFKVTDLTGFTPLSRDLIADNYIAADAVIQRLFARAIAWKKDYEFLNGNGVGKPLGILNSPALVTITKNTASHIKYEDLVAMWAQMHASSWANSMWIASQTTYTDIAGIYSATTSAFAFQPNAMINQAMALSASGNTALLPDMKYRAQGTLLGRPIRFTEKIPALGTTGCLLLVDTSAYGVATRQGLEVGISEHFLFDTDQVAFRFKIRNDGQPMWLAPYLDASSTTTKYSPFLQLTQ